MKVLIQSYNICCQNSSGGVQVRIRQIVDNLRKAGVQVDYFDKFRTKLEDYDVLHIFKINIENLSLIQCAKQKGLKVVMSSIVNLNGGLKIDISRIVSKFTIPSVFRIVKESLDLCDIIIAETPKEAEFVSKHYRLPKEKFRVIPNGVSMQQTDSELIYQKIGKKCDYIIQVGLFDQNKNQYNVIKAAEGAPFDIVFIGGKTTFQASEYYDRCLAEAKGYKNLHFLGWTPSGSELLMSAFRNAKALILPSFQETFGLVAVEAAVSGCHVCLSKTLPIIDYGCFDKELQFAPSSISEIKDVMFKAINKPNDGSVKSKCESIFNWEKVVKQHIDCYS